MPPRRFPPPWTIEEYNDACFIVMERERAEIGLRLFRGGARPAIGGQAAYARRGAADRGQNIAKLPELLRR
jgi:hypothetical protein